MEREERTWKAADGTRSHHRPPRYQHRLGLRHIYHLPTAGLRTTCLCVFVYLADHTSVPSPGFEMKQHYVAQDCTDVAPGNCSVENTIYGYVPSLGANAFFIAIFGVLAIAQLGLGLPKKAYFYSIAIAIGCIGECIGYGGRVMMHDNPVRPSFLSPPISPPSTPVCCGGS